MHWFRRYTPENNLSTNHKHIIIRRGLCTKIHFESNGRYMVSSLVMGKSLEELVDERIAGYDKRLGIAFDQIDLAVGLVQSNPKSCFHYTGASIMIGEAGGMSDEASLHAARTAKAIADAHLTEVGDDDHDPCCAFSSPNPAQGMWDDVA